MAVKIVKRTYNEIYTDGDTDWLLGNVGDWQTLELDVEASIVLFATSQSPIQIDYQNNTFTLTSGETWGSLGFDIGMTFSMRYQIAQDTDDDGDLEYTPQFQSYTITNSFGSTIEVQQNVSQSDFLGFETIPANFGTERITDVFCFASKRPEGCRVQYGHLTNDNFQSQNLLSLIDGSTTDFVKPDIDYNFQGLFQPMEAIGLQSGMSIQSMSIAYDGTYLLNYQRYKYKIKIKFMISSFFEDLANIENKEIPSYLTGDGSLTDNFKINFYPEWNNPNVIIKNDIKKTERLGNTGWFDENFNQLDNDFEVESVEYFDENGNQVDAIDYSAKTKVKAVIGGVPNLNGNTECGVGFAWIPVDEDDYKNKETPLYRNLFVSSGDTNDGFKINQLYPSTYVGGGIDGASMSIESIKFTSLNGKIIFEGTMFPNAQFFTTFDAKDETDRNYVIYLSVSDSSLERNFSDRVTLLADFNSLVKSVPPAGAYPYIDNRFLEHPLLDDAEGEENIQAIIQDDILSRMPFRIKNDGSTVFQRMTFGVEAYNIGLDKKFDLQRYEVDLNQYPTDSSGVQQFDLDTTRGFKLNQGNNKNWVKIKRNVNLDTADLNGYLAHFAFKIRWEDWIQNQDTPNDFFDANELNNGFHNDWIAYLRTQGWEINYFTEIVATVDGDLLQYRNRWNYTFQDYDENQNVQTTHQYFRDSDDTLLNIGTDPDTGSPLGVILSNEPTRIEIEFEILDDGLWDLSETYAVTTIEIDRGAGQFEQRQLSSVWDSESDNPLKPVPGESKLKMEVDATNKFLKTTCLVDPDLLGDGNRYRITGRVGCLNNAANGGFDPGIYESKYQNIYE